MDIITHTLSGVAVGTVAYGNCSRPLHYNIR